MNYYNFEYPLLLLLLLPLLYCLYKCKEFGVQKYFVHLNFLSASKKDFHLEWLVKIFTIIVLVIAIASPVILDTNTPLHRNGKEIVLAIDASGSMNSSGFVKENEKFDLFDGAMDLSRLSRFEVTKLIVAEFIKKRVGDNVGVVLFGDFAFIAAPITYEKEIILSMLTYLTQGMAGQNTAIGEAIAQGVRAFKYSHAKSKIIILLSDGEHNSGSIAPKEATELAKQNSIVIYSVAIGEKNEADTTLLETIAKESGGKFFYASSAKELQEVYASIDALESSAIASSEEFEKEYFSYIFIFMACMGLFYLLYREARR